MWPVPKNVSSASRSPSAATVFRRRVSLCPRRFVRFAAMNFIDREFEFLQEIGPDRALRVRVGSGRERYIRGERALRTGEVDRPGGRPREVLDATRKGDEPGREDWTCDGGDVRREFAGRSLHVRFDRFPLISHELREAGEGLHFSFLSLRELRS